MFNEAMIPFWTAVGSIAAALGVVGALVGWVLNQRKPEPTPLVTTLPATLIPKSPQLEIRRVIEPIDPDLPAAYDVYCEGITNEDERDSFVDIQRWLAEAKTNRLKGPVACDEYLLVATLHSEICGFFYGQYYSERRTFLIGYLVFDSSSLAARRTTSAGIIKFMFDTLRTDIPNARVSSSSLLKSPARVREVGLARKSFLRLTLELQPRLS
jgi:hypothetical protein